MGSEEGVAEGDWVMRMARSHPWISLGIVVSVAAAMWFWLSAIKNPQAAMEREAVHTCAAHLRSLTDRPNSLDIRFVTAWRHSTADGDVAVELQFTEENVFGAKIGQVIRCAVSPAGVVRSSSISYR